MVPMKMLFKLGLGLLVVIVVGLALLVGGLLFFVEPNDYRDEIAQAVEDQTGRQLTIDGDLSLNVVPCCAISLGRTTLSNPPGFETPNFASVDSARLGLQLWPLITRRELRIAELKLEGLDVEIVRLADGSENWRLIGDDENDPESGRGPDDTKDANEDFQALAIEEIDIVNANVTLRDELDKLDYRIENFNLQTGDLEPGEQFDLETSFGLVDRIADSRADVQLTADALLDPELVGLRLEALSGKVGLLSAEWGDVDLDISAPKLSVAFNESVLTEGENLSFTLSSKNGPLGLGGQLDADIEVPALTLSAAEAMQITATSPKFNVQASGGDLPAGQSTGQGTLNSLNYTVDTGAVSLSALKAKASIAGAPVDLLGSGRWEAGKTGIAGSFKLGQVSPRDLFAAFGEAPPETADAQVLKKFSGTGDWQLGDDRIDLSKLQLSLDDTAISGSLAASHFAQLKLNFDLAADQLDLDRYLAPDEPGGNAQSEAKTAGTNTTQGNDFGALRDIKVNGQVKVNALQVAGTQLQDFAAQVKAQDGVFVFEPATANLYGGNYRGGVTINLTGDKPRVKLDQSLAAVQSNGLLMDFAELDQITGLMAARIQASGTGLDQDELLPTLKGDLSIDLADGVYKGMDIWQEIRVARARIRRKPLPAATGPNETAIKALKIAGRLQDGNLRSDNIFAEIPFLRLNGRGNLDVVKQTLDYRLEAKVFEIPTFADGETYDDLLGLRIPLTIRGTLESPMIGVDLADLAKNLAVEKAKQRLLDRLGLGREDAEPEAPSQPAEETQTQPEATPAPDAPAEVAPEAEEESPRDIIKRGIRDLLGG